MEDVHGKAGDQPDFDAQTWRRADRPLEQPAGQRAVDRGSAGAGRCDRRGRSRRQRQGRGHRLRRPNLLRRRGHHRIRQAAAAAVAADSRRHDRKLLEAGGRRDPRNGARRRARGRARLPLSRRRQVGEARHSRSEARPAPRARAGLSGCRASRVSARRSKCARRAIRSARRQAFDCGLVDRLVEGELSRTPWLSRRKFATSARSRNRPNGRTGSPSADPAVFDEFRKENAKRFRGFEAPLKNIEAVEDRDREAIQRRRHRRAQAVHGADGRRAIGGAALFLLCRAQGEQDRGPARKHRAAPDPQGRSDRCRHDGRRDFDELPVGGHPGDDHRDGARKRSTAAPASCARITKRAPPRGS